MKKNLHCDTIFFLWWNATNLFTSINYRNVLVIWLLYCLTGIDCYWYIHFNFLIKKFHCTLFQIMYIFSENGYCFDLLIFKASPWLSTLTLKRTLDFFPERHGSLDHDIRSDAKSTHLLIVISQTEPVLSCINIMNTFFSSTVQPFH